MGNSYMKKPGLIHRQLLDPNQYTLSLIKEGARLGLINQGYTEAFQSRLMTLLADMIMKYTRGESTSVREETAQRILLSILYCLDARLRTFDYPEDALDLLKTGQLKEVYQQGLEQVEACLLRCEALYQHIAAHKLAVPIEAYHATIDEALPEIFHKYDAAFAAHDHLTSLDYPLLFNNMKIQGIFYIYQYLQKLDLETTFCRLFDLKDIRKLLHNYGRVYRINYQEAFINVFEIVLTNSVFSVLSGHPGTEPGISRGQYNFLLEKFKDAGQNRCSLLIGAAMETLLEELHIDQPELKEYIRNYRPVLLPRFAGALENGCLDNVIILEQGEKQPADVFFDAGQRMDDEQFRDLVEDILNCFDPAEKARIITGNVQSLGDYIDILEAECLFGDEYQVLFKTMGDMEASILARIVFMEEIRTDPGSFALADVIDKPMDMRWQVEYAKFLDGLPTERLRAIENYLTASFESQDFSGYVE